MARKKKQSRRLPRISFAWLGALRPQSGTIKRGFFATLWLLLAAGLIGAVYYGVPQLEAASAERHRPESIVVHFVDAPEWFRGDVQAQLLRTVGSIVSADPLSRHDLITVREALLALGWFEDVAQVRRVHAERIEVTATFLQPYAVVRDRDGEHMIDPQGRLLPRTFRIGDSGLVAITGARFPRPQQPGVVWDGADIGAALRVLRLVQGQPWRYQVRVVDVTGQIQGRPMKFVTDRGSKIVWGSPPGEEGALEALASWKLHYLAHLHTTFGHIDMGHAGEVDITSTRTIDQR